MLSLHVPHGVWIGVTASLAVGSLILVEHGVKEPVQKEVVPPVYVVDDSSRLTGFQLLPDGPLLPDFSPNPIAGAPPEGLPDLPGLSFDLASSMPIIAPDLGGDILSDLNWGPEVAPPEIHDAGDVSLPVTPVSNDSTSGSALPAASDAGSSGIGGDSMLLDAQIARGFISNPSPLSTEAVPEPADTVLVTVGLVSLAALMKLRRR